MREFYRQFGPFKGLNTVDDGRNLTDDDLTQAQNIDFDNVGDVELRPGRTLKASGDIHSLWPPFEIPISICLFVEGNALKLLNADYTKTTLKTGLTAGLPMSYDFINGQVWYSNGEVIGYVESLTDHSLSTPAEPFKSAMYPGEIIAFYNNRLYAVKGNAVYYSDPMAFGRRDRRNCRLYFQGRITLFKPVTDGVFISFGGKTFFMTGTEPDQFILRNVADYAAITGTAIDVERKLIGEGVQGRTAMWDSEKGVCLGTDGGGFENLTIKRYLMPSDMRRGASIYRKKNNGIGHFICSVSN